MWFASMFTLGDPGTPWKVSRNLNLLSYPFYFICYEKRVFKENRK